LWGTHTLILHCEHAQVTNRLTYTHTHTLNTHRTESIAKVCEKRCMHLCAT